MDLRTSALALAFGLGFILLLIPLYHYFDSPSISLTQVTLNSSVNLSENVSLNRINASTSAGLLIESHSGADVALFGAGGGQGTTFFDGINTNGLINGINISTRGNLSGSGANTFIAGWNNNTLNNSIIRYNNTHVEFVNKSFSLISDGNYTYFSFGGNLPTPSSLYKTSFLNFPTKTVTLKYTNSTLNDVNTTWQRPIHFNITAGDAPNIETNGGLVTGVPSFGTLSGGDISFYTGSTPFFQISNYSTFPLNTRGVTLFTHGVFNFVSLNPIGEYRSYNNASERLSDGSDNRPLVSIGSSPAIYQSYMYFYGTGTKTLRRVGDISIQLQYNKQAISYLNSTIAKGSHNLTALSDGNFNFITASGWTMSKQTNISGSLNGNNGGDYRIGTGSGSTTSGFVNDTLLSGSGGSMLITTGNGGFANARNNTGIINDNRVIAGNGGSLNISMGNGGSLSATHNSTNGTAGSGGSAFFTAGNGASVSWNGEKAGHGGNITFRAGFAGTNSLNSSNNGINGSIFFMSPAGFGFNNATPNQQVQVIGNANVSGTIYYGALVANSPHAFVDDHVGYTRICMKATDGTIVMQTIQKINNVYQTVYVPENNECNKNLTIKQYTIQNEVLMNGVPTMVDTKITQTQNIWTRNTTELIEKTLSSYPQYQVDTFYVAGTSILYNGTAYEVVQPHTSSALWTPDANPALYKKKILYEYNQVTAWVQPLGSHDCYPLNALVTYQGSTWKNTGSNCNVWQPGIFGWVKQ